MVVLKSYMQTQNIMQIYLGIYNIIKICKLVTFTPSQYVPNGSDHYACHDDSHQVVGQEFDKVVIILDDIFRDNEMGELEGREPPNPDICFYRFFYKNKNKGEVVYHSTE